MDATILFNLINFALWLGIQPFTSIESMVRRPMWTQYNVGPQEHSISMSIVCIMDIAFSLAMMKVFRLHIYHSKSLHCLVC